MRILGINVGFSQPKESTPGGLRHHLSDGSAALLDDGKLVFAGIEERHTRHRYEGGFGNTVGAYWGSDTGVLIEPIDTIAISSCCGPRWPADSQTIEEIEDSLPPGMWKPANGKDPRLLVVDHHDSHAALGFALSGARRCLVAVVDGFGNLIDSAGWNPGKWWRGRFQRHSYFLATAVEGGFSLECISRDAEQQDSVGLGEAYRALTHFCGWRSYQQAGSVMALAAFGEPGLFAGVSFIRSDEKRIRCSLSNDHPNPTGLIENLLRANGISLSALRNRTATPEDTGHCSVIRAMQDQLVEALCIRLLALAAKYQVDTLVVTGGVAMNCLAMGQLQRRFPGRVFVPPAPSDTGQGLGNAIWATSCTASPLFHKSQSRLVLGEAPFWGVTANGVAKAIRHLHDRQGIRILEDLLPSEQSKQAAQLLADGKLVAVCMGRSEYGPRALGGRSVLFDPRRPDASKIVNRFKHRESYRPFAPAILEENVDDFFSWPVQSPFMSFAVEVKPSVRERIPGVLHADGTARVQTVGPQSRSPLRPILASFAQITRIPLILNTSFNRKGEPIVETAFEAIEAFSHSTLDALLLDGVIIQRTEYP